MAQDHYLSKSQIRSLSERSNLSGAWQVLHCWGVIALAITAYILFPYWWVAIPAILIVGSRQLGLAILMHDCAHGILFNSRKANDFIGQVLLAWPVGTDLFAYRGYHLKHHRHTQTDLDPDLGLSAAFPTTRASLLRKFLRDVSGLTALKQRTFQIAQLSRKTRTQAFPVKAVWGFLGVNVLLLLGFSAFGRAELYFLLWLLPLMTWFQWVLRVRNIAEHALAREATDVLTQARTTHAGWLARIFIAPYFVNYHIEHHAYMFIPCYNLARAHQMLMAQHSGEMFLSPNYWTVLKDVTQPRPKEA